MASALQTIKQQGEELQCLRGHAAELQATRAQLGEVRLGVVSLQLQLRDSLGTRCLGN